MGEVAAALSGQGSEEDDRGVGTVACVRRLTASVEGVGVSDLVAEMVEVLICVKTFVITVGM